MEKVTEATLHLEKVTEAMAKCNSSLEYLKVTEAMAKCNLSLNYSQKIFWSDWTIYYIVIRWFVITKICNKLIDDNELLNFILFDMCIW